jgi:putative endonuclease
MTGSTSASSVLSAGYMAQYFTYILLCDQKTYYVGCTSDLPKRLLEHKSKLSFYTSQFSDIEMVYLETFPTLILARRREKQFKGWSHAKKAKFIELRLKESTELAEVLDRMRSSP